MALQDTPFERRVPPTDSNSFTGFDDPLVESLFKTARPQSPYKLQDIDAQTIKFYRGGVESSTTESVSSDLLLKYADSIFASAKEEIFEDGMESDFSRSLSAFILSFGHSAMETIIPIILSDQTNIEVVSEALRVLGRLNHKTTYRDRLWLLEKGLYSASARVRDGAVLGLAFMNDSIAIAPIKSAIKRELTPELRQDMKQVLAQLEGKDGISSKEDTKE